MSHVEQRHRDAAEAWLYARMRARAQSAKGRDHTEALALLLADTERAALDRAAAACDALFDAYMKAEASTAPGTASIRKRYAARGACECRNAIRGLAAAPTTEDRT